MMGDGARKRGGKPRQRVRREPVIRIQKKDRIALCFGYAAAFVVEGVGLLRMKSWAEWLTVVVTASLPTAMPPSRRHTSETGVPPP